MISKYILASALVAAATGCSKHPAEQVVTDYLSQEHCEGRTAFILDSDTQGAGLKSHYADNSDCITKHGKINASSCQNIAVGEYCSVSVEKISAAYCLARTGEKEFKIDWPCSTGWNPVPLKTIKANQPGPDAPVIVRAEAVLSDEHWGGTTAATEVSIRLSDSTDSLQAWMPYARKIGVPEGTIEFAAGVRLKQLLSDGKKHQVLVEVAYLKGKDEAQPYVTWLFQEGWRTIPADKLAEQQKEKLAAAKAFAHPGSAEADKILKCCDKLSALAEDKSLKPTISLLASVAGMKCLEQFAKVRDGSGSSAYAWSTIGKFDDKMFEGQFPAKCSVK